MEKQASIELFVSEMRSQANVEWWRFFGIVSIIALMLLLMNYAVFDKCIWNARIKGYDKKAEYMRCARKVNIYLIFGIMFIVLVFIRIYIEPEDIQCEFDAYNMRVLGCTEEEKKSVLEKCHIDVHMVVKNSVFDSTDVCAIAVVDDDIYYCPNYGGKNTEYRMNFYKDIEDTYFPYDMKMTITLDLDKCEFWLWDSQNEMFIGDFIAPAHDEEEARSLMNDYQISYYESK